MDNYFNNSSFMKNKSYSSEYFPTKGSLEIECKP